MPTSRFIKPWIWMAATILAAAVGGYLYACGMKWFSTACLVLATVGATMMTRSISRIRARIGYIINAALNGDFSYKFPVTGVPDHEKEINALLNRLVVHLEELSYDARQNEMFLGNVINLVDSGIIVADSRGNVIQHNLAALSLLSLPVLTHICQFPKESSSLIINKSDATLHEQNLTIYTVNDIRRPLQAAEVESWEKLTRVLTHEIMNSLTPISSIADTLTKSSTPDELRASLDVITSSTRSLMSFVKNFRKFTLLPEPQPKVIYLRPFLEKTAALVPHFLTTEAGCVPEVTLTVMPPDMMVYADEPMLNQVVVNILKNAAEASPCHIAIIARIRNDESVEIDITNDGVAIPDEIAEQVFTPFFSTKPSGSGIGLSLSRRIITRLGGTLALTTHPETCFTITLY